MIAPPYLFFQGCAAISRHSGRQIFFEDTNKTILRFGFFLKVGKICH